MMWFLAIHVFLLLHVDVCFGKFEPGQCNTRSCLNHGVCVPGAMPNTHWCRCVEGWTGNRCEIVECDRQCKNRGVCRRNEEGNPTCACQLGFEGDECEKEAEGNVCRGRPCGFHGNCHLNGTLDQYECRCHNGWTGVDCSEAERCPPGHCRNGGQCMWNASDDSYQCSCPPNFEGSRCEKDVDECARGLCMHGKCINSYGNFHCECDSTHVGILCELPRTRKHCTGPVLRSSDAALEFSGWGRQCMNGGICDMEHNSFTCICPPMYTGEFCESDVNECEISPCYNGGTCHDYEGGSTCICPSGFDGERCEKNRDDCVGQPCGRGRCVDGIGMYTCECPEGTIGENCELDDPCVNLQPCMNGRCSVNPLSADYQCDCYAGFTGGHCSQDVDECAASPSLCSLRGVCVNTPGSFFCQCDEGFTGERCESAIPACDPNPCLNHGTCFDAGSGYQCFCPAGYVGLQCESKTETCEDSPCEHGSCIPDDNDWKCECPAGYRGSRCDIVVNLCHESTCANGGVCMHDAQSGFRCSCPESFSGSRCEEKLNACEFVDCGENKICRPTSTNQNYTCECQKGWTGTDCLQDVDECQISTCEHGTCENEPGSFRCRCEDDWTGETCAIPTSCSTASCLNNGSCIDVHNGFKCICPLGFTGSNCETNIVLDDCVGQPCEHGGRCIDGINGFECQCKSGYSGEKCQVDIDECVEGQRSCENGGTCVDGIASYSCACTREFAGKFCEKKFDVDKYNVSDGVEKEACARAGCASLAKNGRCDALCAAYACGFDGGDCAATTVPYALCPVASYCSQVFHNNQCDEVCNNQECLFDGFDCVSAASRCPRAEFCQARYADGRCDAVCNTEGCGFDGGDCENKHGGKVLPGDVVVRVEESPARFVKKVNLYLMKLSARLRATLRIKSDDEGAMVFQWENEEIGERIHLTKEQLLSVQYGGVVRNRRSFPAAERVVPAVQVVMWLEVDVADCLGNECFSDVEAVASYLGRAVARKDLDVPIASAIARRPSDDRNAQENKTLYGILLAAVGLMAVVATVYVLQQQQFRRSRKRKMISAPTWMPPTEAQLQKYAAMQSEQALRQSMTPSMYGEMFVAGSETKRAKLGSLLPLHHDVSLYHPAMYDRQLVTPVMPVPRVELPPKSTKVYHVPQRIHLEAAGIERIALPIEKEEANSSGGPGDRTPLIWLAYNAVKAVEDVLADIDALISAGAEINAQDDDEETAIFVAARAGRLEVVKRLLEKGADPCLMSSKDSTCLHKAVENFDLEMVEELLKIEQVRKEVNEVDIFDRTALMYAARDDLVSMKIAAALIEAGSDPSYPGDKSIHSRYRGRTALHYAAQHDNIQMIEYLLSVDDNKDATDAQEQTPLWLAASEGRIDAVSALVKAGASIEITDQKERTPRDIAIDRGYPEVARALQPDDEPLPPIVKKTAMTKILPTKTTVKRMVAARRKPQPLTPPHSDGGHTPSPHDLGRPLLAHGTVLHSPDTSRTHLTSSSSGSESHSEGGAHCNGGFSPQGMLWGAGLDANSSPSGATQADLASFYGSGGTYLGGGFSSCAYDTPNQTLVDQSIGGNITPWIGYPSRDGYFNHI